MASSKWINFTDTKQSDFLWAIRKYETQTYVFAEEYDRHKVKEKVLKTHRIKDAIEKHKQETGVDSNTAYRQASEIIDEIAHTFSFKTIRFMALIVMKIIRSLFKQVLVNKDGIRMFKECAKFTPIVLVPTHNSYFDFLLASCICFALDLPLPAIVTGQDFLHVAIVNHLFRGSGAFYMRRSFASDSFYRSIFTEYTQHILCLGDRPIEFFPEGTRSRCGKALQPKVGLLSMVLEGFFHGFLQDVSFIPMSISYEKIAEEQLYMFELLGLPKPKESLSGLFKARSILSSDFGTVVVHFGEKMSLREYCLGKINGMDYINTPRCERHLKIFGREEQEMKIAKYFGETLIYAQQSEMVIFPRAVVASLLLQKQQAINLDDLSYTVDKLARLLEKIGCKLYGFEGVLTDKNVILKAVEYSNVVLSSNSNNNEISYEYSAITDDSMKRTNLFKVFGVETELISQSLGYIYLSCQRNKLMHHCLASTLLLHSILFSSDVDSCRNCYFFLCKLFKNEFIFDPDVSADHKFLEAVDLLSTQHLITVFDSTCHVNKINSDEVQFILHLLQPFIDAYMVIMDCLMKNTHEFPVSFKSFTSVLQLQTAKFITTSHIKVFECLSLHTLSNCMTSLCKTGHLMTIKNDKFETLVKEINTDKIKQTTNLLGKLITPELKVYMDRSKL